MFLLSAAIEPDVYRNMRNIYKFNIDIIKFFIFLNRVHYLIIEPKLELIIKILFKYL